MNATPHRPWADSAGTVASAACAMHRLIVSTAPAVLSLLGLGFLMHGPWENVLVGSAVVIAAYSAWNGQRTGVSGRGVLVAFVVGVLLLGLGRVVELTEAGIPALPLSLLGGATLVGAHLRSMADMGAATSGPGFG